MSVASFLRGCLLLALLAASAAVVAPQASCVHYEEDRNPEVVLMQLTLDVHAAETGGAMGSASVELKGMLPTSMQTLEAEGKEPEMLLQMPQKSLLQTEVQMLQQQQQQQAGQAQGKQRNNTQLALMAQEQATLEETTVGEQEQSAATMGLRNWQASKGRGQAQAQRHASRARQAVAIKAARDQRLSALTEARQAAARNTAATRRAPESLLAESARVKDDGNPNVTVMIVVIVLLALLLLATIFLYRSVWLMKEDVSQVQAYQSFVYRGDSSFGHFGQSLPPTASNGPVPPAGYQGGPVFAGSPNQQQQKSGCC